ncbi:MAG: GtrA family protein [Clostridia bacterium]|nr:GtrA family protein [Clostridia bacterium]
MAVSNKCKSIFIETVKFVIVGLISFAIDYIAFLIFNRIIFGQDGGEHTVLTTAANIIGYCVGVIVNYFLLRIFVFTADYQRENGKGAKALILFILSSIIGLILTVVFTGVFMYLYEMIDLSRFNSLFLESDSLGKITATFLVTIWNYLSKKLFIFK